MRSKGALKGCCSRSRRDAAGSDVLPGLSSKFTRRPERVSPADETDPLESKTLKFNELEHRRSPPGEPIPFFEDEIEIFDDRSNGRLDLFAVHDAGGDVEHHRH